MVEVRLPVFLVIAMALALTLGTPSTVHAETEPAAVYPVDPAASVIGFTIAGSMIVKIRKDGNFKDFSGELSYDPARPTNTHVDLTVVTASVDMQNPKHEELVKSADFFDVEHFPTMHFKSTSTEINRDGTFSMTGDMTIRGVTRQMTIPVQLRKAPQADASSGIVFETTFPIDRTDFGLNGKPDWGGFKVSIAKNVQIHIAIATAINTSPFTR